MKDVFCGAVLLLLPLLVRGQELREHITVFTDKQTQQILLTEPHTTKRLRSATFYADGTVASLSYSRKRKRGRMPGRFSGYRLYSFYKDGRIRSLGRHDIFGFFRRKTWNRDGQLVEKYRRNPGYSTSYTYLRRQFAYQNSRVVKKKVTKMDTGCFSSKLVWNKTIEVTDQGKVVTVYTERETPIDSAFQQEWD